MNKIVNKLKTFFVLVITPLLVISGFSFAGNYSVNAESDSINYEIYPQPQAITYSGSSFKMSDTVNLILEEELDVYTVDKAKQILSDKGLSFEVSDSMSSDLTNVLVGVNGSNETVDQYFKDKVNAENNFDEIDAHLVSIQDNVIAISGKDTDASFYGLVSLEHILNQSEDNVIANLLIEDYANTQIRGVIEGYYGIPWGNDNRANLIEFGGQFKANTFVFAPKDDPYHRERWSELYPADELEGHGRLAQLGNKTKNRYVWTIAPFQPQSDPITPDNEEEGIAKLIAKFEQLYDVGVRQFGVLGDDVGALPKQTVVNVMKKVSQWAAEKGDIYDFVFVPQGYVLADWGFNAEELNLYDAEFPDDIQIMFTGQNTLSRITQDAVTGFKTKQVTSGERRDPLFWLNWPVNDIDRKDYRRLFMGKGEMMQPGVKNMVGVLTNPMEESQPSKVAIFAVADYSWNNVNFQAEQSWVDSFKYIEPSAPQEMHEISKHMSNMNNGGIGGLEESEELKQPIEDFNEAIQNDDKELIKEKGESLQTHYQNIVNAVDSFMENASEQQLKQEMAPYISGLRDKSQAAIGYIEVIMFTKGAKDGSIDLAEAALIEANKNHQDSQSYTVNTKTSEFPTVELRAESGMLRINPNVTDLKALATDFLENKKNAEEVDRLIAQFKEADEVTEEYRAKVKAAREAYDALSEEAKALVHPANVEKLERAEAKIADADNIPGKKGWVKEGSNWYYYDENGALQTGWTKVNNTWYYLDENGVMQTDWQKVNGTWYYMNASGAMQTGWTKVNHTWYYMNSSGAMQTGWTKVNNTWYYLNPSGAMQTSWVKVNNTWYYLNPSGAMQTGWTKVNNTWYYLNPSGAMQTGWTKVSNTWYYLNPSGAMQTGWVKVNNTWYYMNSSGAMQIGWVKVNNTWYYLNPSGAMQTGWLKLGNDWYYLNKDGSMQTENAWIDGTWYQFDASGRML